MSNPWDLGKRTMNKNKKNVGRIKTSSTPQILRHQDSFKSVTFGPSPTNSKKKLPCQEFMDTCEIRISDCTILYKLKHIETQASKSRRRKIGKSMGFTFPSLRSVYQDGKPESGLFSNCIFNPSDRTILHEHIKNLETPKIRFVNCKFLRRKKALMKEKLQHFWRWQTGALIKFSCETEKNIEISKQTIWLNDMPPSLEYVIEKLNQ